jgi:hypothetical protein
MLKVMVNFQSSLSDFFLNDHVDLQIVSGDNCKTKNV